MPTPNDLYLLAHQHYAAGNPQQAANLLHQALQIDPAHPESVYFLAVLFEQDNQLDHALAYYEQVHALRPTWPGPCTGIGNVLRAQGKIDQAIAMQKRAVELQPKFVPGWLNLGSAFESAHKPAEALAAYDRALQLEPSHAMAWYNRGVALRTLCRFEESADACRRSIALNPNYAPAHNNLGTALEHLGQLDAAQHCYREALRHQPDSKEALNNLACLLHVIGEFDDSLATFRRTLQLHPGDALAHSNLLYLLLFHPDATPEMIRAEHDNWNRLHALPLAHLIPKHTNDRNPDRPLRIGYVSPDFRDNVVARNALPIFRCHDREQFQLFFYMTDPRHDSITDQFQSLAHAWRNISTLYDDQAAALIQQDQIDILVDLSLHMAGNRLLVFARKPAPIQFTFAGYPGTTGLTAIDYRLTDPYLDPPPVPGRADQPDPADAYYSEKSLRLPHTFWIYDPLDLADIPVNDLPAKTNGYITFGCLNNFNKLNNLTIARWSAILNELPTSRLHLYAPEGAHRQRTLNTFKAQGISPDRITFFPRLPREQYLRLYCGIDIALDTLPYNAHTTGLDALWMGVPTVTLAGDRVTGRAGNSQLQNVGLPELVANNNSDYTAIACHLARDIPRLAALRQSLRSSLEKSPIMNAAAFTRALDEHFRAAWQRWVAT